jgi:hypothetical protein
MLTGKLARLAKGANWVLHLLSHLYFSIAYALSENKRLLTESSAEFQDIVLAIRTNAFVTPCKELAWHTSFCHEACGKTVPSRFLSVKHQQNHALQNQILLQQA